MVGREADAAGDAAAGTHERGKIDERAGIAAGRRGPMNMRHGRGAREVAVRQVEAELITHQRQRPVAARGRRGIPGQQRAMESDRGNLAANFAAGMVAGVNVHIRPPGQQMGLLHVGQHDDARVGAVGARGAHGVRTEIDEHARVRRRGRRAVDVCQGGHAAQAAIGHAEPQHVALQAEQRAPGRRRAHGGAQRGARERGGERRGGKIRRVQQTDETAGLGNRRQRDVCGDGDGVVAPSRLTKSRRALHGSRPSATAPAQVELLSSTSRTGNSWLALTLIEGRCREVRRMLACVGRPVSKLKRIRIGPVDDRGLDPGGVRQLTIIEIERLKKGRGPTQAQIRRAAGRRDESRGDASRGDAGRSGGKRTPGGPRRQEGR